MGTEANLLDAIVRRMFESGFLVRPLCFIGDKLDVPREHRGVRLSERAVMTNANRRIAEWKVRFASLQERWSFRNSMNDWPAFIWPDSDETADWLAEMTANLADKLDHHPDREVMSGAARRLNVSVTKMAALIAIADGRFEFTKDDLLVGFMTAEISLGNMLYVLEQVSASEHSKNLDLLETVIASYPTGAHSSEVYRTMSSRGKGFSKREVDGMVEELRSQKRLKAKQVGFGFEWEII